MLIDKAGLARLIPHEGPMCLLDGVLSWDVSRVRCEATTHRSEDNPMRRDGRLGILCGVEYAAQAMAVHAALAGSRSASQADIDPTGDSALGRQGFLASLRAVTCHTDRLDTFTGPLLVEAACLHAESDRMIYGFSLWHRDSLLLEGRAVVVLATRMA